MAGILTAAVASTFSGVTADPYYEYTTLLLPGNGTNGAQNNTFLDGSTNNFTITRNGNTTQGTFSPFSQTGWGNYFDGTGDYLTVPDNAAFTMGSGDWTFECWIFPTISANAMILGQYSGGLSTSGPLLYFNTSNNVVLYAYDVGAATTRSVSAAVTLNQWTHIAGVRDGNSAKLYINGTSSGTPATFSGGIPDSTVVMGIGARDNGTENFGGYISNARIVKGVAVYTGNFTPPTSPLAATQSAGTNISAITGTQTSLLTCQSNRFIDNSTNNFTITKNGDTRVVAFSPFSPTASWSAATYGGSGYFDGSGDYLSAPASNITDFATGQAFTFECWFYTTSTAYQSLIRSTNGFFCDFTGTSVGYGKAGVAYIINPAATVNLNQWNHFAVSRNTSNQSRLWLNGVTAGSNSSDNYSFSNDSVIIGLAAGSYLSGYISGMRVVKGTAVYDPTQTSITVPTAPLTAITNTSLLLNFANAGIYDATSKNDLETVGDAQISNAITPKWGSTSIKFDGTGDWLDALASNQLFNLSSGDWTIEAWIYRNASGATHTILNLFNASANNSGLTFYVNASNQLVTDNGTVAALAAGTVASGQWVHVAIVRSGSTTTGYVNGTSVGTTTQAPAASQYARIGALASGFNLFNGYIQDLRITKGYARYTANFTAPTAAFLTL